MTTVVAGVIERAGRVLIGQRKPGGHHPLKWEFPGGKVEPGETPQHALARELAEELGVRARIGEELMRYPHQYAGRAAILLIFFRVAVDGEPRNLAFAQMQWVPREDFERYDFLEGDAEFLRSGAISPGS